MGLGYFDIGMLAIAAVLVLFALIKGCMRGGIRSFVRFLLVAICAVGAYLFSQTVVDTALATDITAAGLQAVDGTAFSGTAQEYIVEMIMSAMQGTGMETLFENPDIQTILFGIVAAIVAVVVFLVAFFVLKAVSLIVYGIIKIFIPKRGRNGKRLKRSKLMGLLFSLLQAAVVYAVIAIPVFGLLNVADVAMNEFEDASFVESNAETKEMLDGVDAILTETKEGMVYTFFDSTSLRQLGVDAFNRIYKITTADGKEMYPLEEIVDLLPIVRNVLDVSEVFSDISSMTPENIETLKNLFTSIGESELLTEALAGVIDEAADAWANGEEFFGFSFTEDSGMDAATVDLVQELCNAIKDADAESIKEDLNAIANCVDVLDEYGVFERVADMGEDADVLNEILNIIAEEKENSEGENTALIDALCDALSESEHLSTLFPALTNYGVQLGTQAMGVPKDKDTAYDNMLGDISSAATSAADVDEDAIDSEIEALASAGAVRDLSNVYVPEYLAAEGNSSYAAWMNMNESAWKSMQKNGFSMGEASYRRTVNGTEYVYLGKDSAGRDIWKKYADLDAAKREEVDKNKDLTSAVQTLVEDLKVAAGTGSLTKEAVQEGFRAVAETLQDEAKAIFVSASDPEVYKTAENVNVITFEDNFKINVKEYFDGTKEDRKEKMDAIGSVVKDAVDVVKNITEIGGSGEMDLVESIQKIDFEKLGTALNGIGTLTGRDNFATDILRSASDIVEDPFMKDLMIDVADKMEESKNDPDADEKFDFETLGQSMQAATSLISFFTEGTDFAAVSAEEWANVLYNLTRMDSTTLEIVQDNISGLLSGSSVDEEEKITLFVTIVLDSVKAQSYTSKDDINAVKDGQAIKDLVDYFMDPSFGELDGDEAFVAVCEEFKAVAADSGFVRTVIAALLNDMGTSVKNNEAHSMFPFTFNDFASENYDPANPTLGDKVIFAWLDAFIAITPETVVADLELVITFFETFSHAELDFIGDAANENSSPADNIEEAIATATVTIEGETMTFREALLAVFEDATSSTYDGLEEAVSNIAYRAQ